MQSNEVANSNAMEKERLIRAGKFVSEENGFSLTELVIDRLPQIQKWMRETQPNTKHYFDVWQMAKGFINMLITTFGHYISSHTMSIKSR